MKKALFPGTFDPPTLGHVDIIRRSASICDKLYVGIATNTTKTDDLFTVQEREAMLKTVCKPYPHAEVVRFSTLLSISPNSTKSISCSEACALSPISNTSSAWRSLTAA